MTSFNLSSTVQRILQTGAIVGLVLAVGGCFIIVPSVLIISSFTRYWWIFLLYILWYIYFDRENVENGNRRWEWFRNCVWFIYAKNYFPLQVKKLPWGNLDPKRNYLFCFSPHGIFAISAILTVGTNVTEFSQYFPNHKSIGHTLNAYFNIPFIRELVMWLGVLPVSEKCISHVLSKPDGGNIAGIVVGGAAEAECNEPGVHKIVYKRRKGFVRIALKTGSPLVPVYCFGETDVFSRVEVEDRSVLKRISNEVKRLFGFPIFIPMGEYLVIPKKRPLTVVVGEPLDVQKTENPTQEQIDEVHLKFQENIIKLFDSQKKYYLVDYDSANLEMI